MIRPIPEIMSSGREAEAAFRTIDFLDPDEEVIAFFFASDSVVVTPERIVMGDLQDPESLSFFPAPPATRLEERGMLGVRYLASDSLERKVALKSADYRRLKDLMQTFELRVAEHRAHRDADSTSGPTAQPFLQEPPELAGPQLLDAEEVILATRFATRKRGEAARAVILTSDRLIVLDDGATVAQLRSSAVERFTWEEGKKTPVVSVALKDGRVYALGTLDHDGLRSFLESSASALASSQIREEPRVAEFTILPEDFVVGVAPYSALAELGDRNRQRVASGGGGSSSLHVFRHALRHGHDIHILDAYVSAEVTTSGGVQVSHRPTLTRMAVGSILPGTALIPGLAFQKKTLQDSRTVLLTCVHPEWFFDVNVDPDHAASAILAANFINSRSEALSRGTGSSPAEPNDSTNGSSASQIREMKALLDEGIITQDDFDRFKTGLLG